MKIMGLTPAQIGNRLLNLTPASGRLATLIRKEFKSPVPVDWSVRYRCWRQGFIGESAAIYNRPDADLSDYLSDFARQMRTPRINGDFREVLDNKLVFFFAAKDYVSTPRAFAVVGRTGITPLDATVSLRDFDAFLDFCTENAGLVLRRVRGGGGARVYILRAARGGFYLNDQLLDRAGAVNALQRLPTDNYIVTEFVEQGSYSSEIFGGTTNTIRVITMVDPETRDPFIPIAVHRFGTRRSVPVDNWSKGGLSVKVDIDSGELSRGVTFPTDGTLQWHDRHPDTGAQIWKRVVPGWAQARDAILDLAAKLSFLSYVGWDVVVTDTGFTMIEGNNYTDVNLLQVHQPLLADERVRRFYRHHAVIR